MTLHFTSSTQSMLKRCGYSAVLASALLFATPADAKPARQGIIMSVQPDGSELPIRMQGDEFAHRVFSEDGYLLTENADGYMTYAVTDASGAIVSSKVRALPISKRTSAEKAFLSSVDKESIVALASDIDIKQRASFRSKAAKPGMQRAVNSQGVDLLFSDFPTTGSPKALVILVEYEDVAFSMEDEECHDFYTRLVKEEGFSDYGATGSCLDYFTENSKGLFTPEFDVYGPVTLSHKRSYYGGNDAYGNDLRPENMVIDACKALDDQIDFTQYDNDGDGIVDNVFVFYAGYGEADGGGSNTVWPHSYNITYSGKRIKVDGVLLDRYACTCEMDFSYKRPDGIGTFVHEFSHVMGLPDLYATQYTSSFTPGTWSVLDYGPYNNQGRTPPAYSIHERYAVGWMEPKTITEAGEYDITLAPINENDGYRFPTYDAEGKVKPNEFILIEAREKEGWDKYIPGEGMLVWRIDYDKDTWDYNQVNNDPRHQCIDILEADNTRSETTRNSDSFPGRKNITEFTESTKPAFLDLEGNTMYTEITNIAKAERGVTFHLTSTLPESGVNEIAGNGSAMNISLNGRTLTVNSDKDVRVITLAGLTAASLRAGESFTLPTSGIYMVTDGKSVRKIAVR